MEQENTAAETADTLLQLVTFAVGGEKYGVDILNVEEIMKMVPITKLPGSPDDIDGIINLRGKVIPVMDLRTKMRLPRKEYGAETRIVVAETRGETVGIVVDSVAEVMRIPRSVTEPPPEMTSGTDSKFVSAIGKLDDKIVILLDVERLVAELHHSRAAAAA